HFIIHTSSLPKNSAPFFSSAESDVFRGLNYAYFGIATYLGFSSQSHLGKQFKKITKMTLKQYRDCFGVKEFI
ncbi:hypothetical protein CG709_13065, partial [Lachnotalea glycerini]